MAEVSSSPLLRGATQAEELHWYKSHYELLESELHEFQQSSRELEQELEKDIEASEKRERELNKKIEQAKHDVDDWKTRHKQAKAEASAAHAVIEKEITGLRETNRTMQMKLRDVEVMNDDFERQARHTTSSLEDLENKYNVAIERGVMMEEEIKHVELERENFRIEVQRLKDELSDLRIENEITTEKLRLAESSLSQSRGFNSPAQILSSPRPRSRGSENSTPATTVSSPTISTPPPQSVRSELSTTHSSPPSPPRPNVPTLSHKKSQYGSIPTSTTPMSSRSRLPTNSFTNKMPPPSMQTPTTVRALPRHSRGPSRMSNGATLTAPRPSSRTTNTRPLNSRPSIGGNIHSALPRSGSLFKIQALTQKMQTLEARVQSVRSRLPAPISTPPHVSPRGSARSSPHNGVVSPITNNVTVRSRRRQSQGTATSGGDQSVRSPPGPGVSRLSFGPSQYNMKGTAVAGASSAAGISRPSSRVSQHSAHLYKRPSSRLSTAGQDTESINSAAGHGLTRPGSALAGTYTFSNTPTATGNNNAYNPRQSISSAAGSYRPETPARSKTPGPTHYRTASLLHHNPLGTTQSTHSTYTTQQDGISEHPTERPPSRPGTGLAYTTPQPNRRKTLERSGIPTPSAGRRQSNGATLPPAPATGPIYPSVSRRVSRAVMRPRSREGAPSPG